MIRLKCPAGIEECTEHEFPDSWILGGADEQDPRADPRFYPDRYEYLDDQLQTIMITTSMLCENQAIDHFTQVRDAFQGKVKPKYLLRERRDPTWLPSMPDDHIAALRTGTIPKLLKAETVQWEYDADTDTVTPLVKP